MYLLRRREEVCACQRLSESEEENSSLKKPSSFSNELLLFVFKVTFIHHQRTNSSTALGEKCKSSFAPLFCKTLRWFRNILPSQMMVLSASVQCVQNIRSTVPADVLCITQRERERKGERCLAKGAFNYITH